MLFDAVFAGKDGDWSGILKRSNLSTAVDRSVYEELDRVAYACVDELLALGFLLLGCDAASND